MSKLKSEKSLKSEKGSLKLDRSLNALSNESVSKLKSEKSLKSELAEPPELRAIPHFSLANFSMSGRGWLF